jgi:hypothetical protein
MGGLPELNRVQWTSWFRLTYLVLDGWQTDPPGVLPTAELWNIQFTSVRMARAATRENSTVRGECSRERRKRALLYTTTKVLLPRHSAIAAHESE